MYLRYDLIFNTVNIKYCTVYFDTDSISYFITDMSVSVLVCLSFSFDNQLVPETAQNMSDVYTLD